MGILRIFKIKAEERIVSVVTLIWLLLLNGLVVWKYWDKFSVLSDSYHRLFVNTFRISGFDPLTYEVLSNWTTAYNIYRHPLLAFFMYPANQLDQLLIMLTGQNWAHVITAAILVFCGFYSFIFLLRIFREVIELKMLDSVLLSVLNFGFAYVMVSVSVPDHFAMSMLMLILALYVAGRRIKSGRPFKKWQTVVYFFITAGISLNNGIKIFLANLFVNGKQFFKPSNIILAVLIPSALIWGGARLEWNTFEKPKFQARQAKKQQKAKDEREKVWQAFCDTVQTTDEGERKALFKKLMNARAIEKYKRDHQKPWNKHTGKPIAKGEFSQWTDVTTNRWSTAVENLFGESLLLHEDHLLEDTLKSRPVIVEYRCWFNYIVEALIVLLFVAGIWFGRRERLMWLAMSFWTFDMLIHMVLGFGINEVYIMTAHWAFVLPIVMGYLFREQKSIVLRAVLGLCCLWCLGWNMTLYIKYLIG